MGEIGVVNGWNFYWSIKKEGEEELGRRGKGQKGCGEELFSEFSRAWK